ncbi:MAG: HAMP domain-containing protein [Clostridia bacterium]|nr:HAMP domain-containing protein [Clostridia bacterium]
MFKSIQWKIIAIFLLLTVSVMIVTGTFLLQNISAYYYNDFSDSLTNQVFNSDFTEELENAAKGANSKDTIMELLGAYSIRMGIDSFRNYYLLDSSLNILGSSTKASGTIEGTPNLLLALTGSVGTTVDKNAEYMDYAFPIKIDKTTKYIVYISDTKEEINDVLGNMFINIFWALLFGLLLSAILGFFLSRTIIAPISSLQSRSEALAEGDFGRKLEVRSRDEIGRLTVAFNNMAARINGSMEEIQTEKNKIEAILLHMTDAVAAYDNSGNLIHINPAGEALLNEYKNETFDNLFERLEANISLYRILYIDPTETIERDIEFNNKTLKAFFAPFNTERSLAAGVVVVFHDRTHQQMLDNSRREFVANVSHELRTPLTTIKSYAETISDMAQDIDNESPIRSFIKVIENEADRMTRLVKDLLTLSQFDSNKREIKREKFNLAKLITNIVEKMSINAKSTSHRIKLSIDMKSEDYFGEPDAIEQVLTNIISNSIKYTHNGGKIDVVCHSDFENITITVKDNGIGIPENDLARIFERFYRVDKARSRQSGGTGLGLAIAKEIITRHSGTIEIFSPEQKGTLVKITLPLFEKVTNH